MSYLTVQKEILDRLATVRNVDLHRGQATDEYLAKLIEGTDQIKPFIVVSFGNRVQTRRGMNGIVGARANSYGISMTTHCVANTEANANAVNEKVWETLIGFEPTNCSELIPALFGGVGELSSTGSPSRFTSMQGWTSVLNSDHLE